MYFTAVIQLQGEWEKSQKSEEGHYTSFLEEPGTAFLSVHLCYSIFPQKIQIPMYCLDPAYVHEIRVTVKK